MRVGRWCLSACMVQVEITERKIVRLSKIGRRYRRLVSLCSKRGLNPDKQPWSKDFEKWAIGPEGKAYYMFKSAQVLFRDVPDLRDFALSISDIVDIQNKEIRELRKRVFKLERRK